MAEPKHNRKLIEQLTRERDEALAERDAAFAEIRGYAIRAHDAQAHPWRNLWRWMWA